MNTTLNGTLAKVMYVAGVTTFCTFLGCWAVLAHQGSMAASRPSMMDTHFAKAAAQGGMAEVKLGQLAVDHGTNDAVKSFGQHMVDDHTKAGDQLKQVAQSENMNLPGDISAKDKASYDALSKLSGAAFDKAYARDMVKDHEEDIAEFQKEANGGKDQALKNFATETLPTLKDHLKQAREMMKAVTTTARTTHPSAAQHGRR
ncbi:MAG TPA: DUF4142 domain-containing protein [Candidatus Acidoferrum sp.]|jgi:putative membrane protein